jgi:hypothetical protein
MRTAAIVSLLLCALPFGSMADKPRVNRGLIEAMEKSVDWRLQRLWPGDSAEVLGLTQGAYINGYGAVFMSEINVAPTAGITPFHPTVTPDEVKRTHDKKLQRIAGLRDAMREILMDSAGSLDTVPGEEQVTLSISLFYWTWEKRDGLPAQIVMHASKKSLLQAKAGTADKGAIVFDEF